MISDIRPAAEPPALTDEERQPCEIWSRVMGYHRPVDSFNRGKQAEFRDRTYFREQNPATPTPEPTPETEDPNPQQLDRSPTTASS